MNPSEFAKYEALQRLAELDAADHRLGVVVSGLGIVANQADNPDITFARLAFCVANQCIPYQRDTDRVGGEDIAGLTRPPEPALAPMKRKEDCDGKARLFVALCLARGLKAEIVPHWTAEGELRHVSAKVWGGRIPVPLHAELTLARAILGDLSAEVPAERNGKLKTS